MLVAFGSFQSSTSFENFKDLRPLVAVRGPRTLRALRASITLTAQTPSRAPIAFRASKVQAHLQL